MGDPGASMGRAELTEGAMIGREDSIETGIVVMCVFAGGLMAFKRGKEPRAGGNVKPVEAGVSGLGE
jgi:hypothetical protein